MHDAPDGPRRGPDHGVADRRPQRRLEGEGAGEEKSDEGTDDDHDGVFEVMKLDQSEMSIWNDATKYRITTCYEEASDSFWRSWLRPALL